ncbi:MAG: hypothetical protein AAGE01_10550 [Pseudomonadota bacterium]
MLRPLVVALLLFADAACGQALTPPSELLNRAFADASAGVGDPRDLIERVLEYPEHANVVMYYAAAAFAFERGELIDAGYLFYAGQIRGNQELRLRPPDDGGEQFVIMSDMLGPQLNPALFDPEVYPAVLDRLEAWDPTPARGFTLAFSPTDAQLAMSAAQAGEFKEEMLAPLRPLSELLKDSDYFEAVRDIQRFHMELSPEEQQEQSQRRRYDEARERVRSLEESAGVSVLSPSLGDS